MLFAKALHRRFAFTHRPSRDNLPVAAIPRYRKADGGDYGRKALARMARDLGYRSGVEIGTHDGESAVIWCSLNSRLRLTCIDPYGVYHSRNSQGFQDKHYETACKALEPYSATIVREKSLDVVDRFEHGSIDFVFIDGDHEFDAVMQDLIRWAPKVRRGGMVMLHDYSVFWWGGVIAAVDAYTTAHRVRQWYVTRDQNPTAFWERGAERAR